MSMISLNRGEATGTNTRIILFESYYHYLSNARGEKAILSAVILVLHIQMAPWKSIHSKE